uniref:Poly(A) RNA polymerase protein 2 isoform X2 n=1 Tax=Elaeis guineensis var. tenera TaxID=51953 RepID=A0A6J0PKA1_ELAGV|nr:poly(A) RNA polymerase protein 2 isoform X2 [Elaeis guineensis]
MARAGKSPRRRSGRPVPTPRRATGLWSRPGSAPAVVSRAPCFSSTKRYSIFVILSHQLLKNEPHVLLLYNVFLRLSNTSGRTAKWKFLDHLGQAYIYQQVISMQVVILESKVKTPQMGLYALARALSQRSIVKKMQVIAKARVPIVKFVEKRSGIYFDISFDVDGGPKAADFIKDALKKMPPLRPLCLILKVFLQQRELNEVYSGGIGSYALLAMLIAHLQMQWRGQDMQKPMEHNLGVLLVNFFDFYGRKLNIWDVGVSCNSAGTFFLKSDKRFMNTERPYLLSIEDPQAPDNDIGRNSYNYFKVRSAFAMAYSLLTDANAIIGLGPYRSILGTIIRPDPMLLDRKGGNKGELTFSDLLPGAGESLTQQFENGGDTIYNWQLVDDEPLPRGKVLAEDDGISSCRKRRASKTKQRFSKTEKLGIFEGMQEENGVRRERGVRKRWKGSRDKDESTKSHHGKVIY